MDSKESEKTCRWGSSGGQSRLQNLFICCHGLLMTCTHLLDALLLLRIVRLVVIAEGHRRTTPAQHRPGVARIGAGDHPVTHHRRHRRATRCCSQSACVPAGPWP